MNKFGIKVLSLGFAALTVLGCSGFVIPSQDYNLTDNFFAMAQETDRESITDFLFDEGDLQANTENSEEKKYIKWVDFNANERILKKVYNYAVELNKAGIEFSFSKAMAYLATKNGNSFKEKTDLANLDKLIARIRNGENFDTICEGNKYFEYYKEAFGAIFDGIIGKYSTDTEGEVKYGICGYFPLAKGYWYSHYDDFGNSRSYGFKRKHLGHDIMGAVGTPVIAVEGGTVTEFGWNRYGGWRIGIRSFDSKRYYYYAHLRKGKPYPAGLEIGKRIEAGQVIGFLGNTGYSVKEDVNLKTGKPHLHFGMQLIFDESQVKGNNEIWIDVYGLCGFLSPYRAKTTKNPDTNEQESLDVKYRDLNDFLS